MSKRGVFKVDRGVFEHPAFKNEPFSEREAWLWLLAEAAYKPKQKALGRLHVSLDRGQLAHSTRFMAARWQWSEARVRRFLARLKGDAQTDALIDARADAGVTVVTICKYDTFQLPALRSDAPTDAKNGERATQTKENKYLSYKRTADASAISAEAEDPRAVLFRAGFAMLRNLTGKPDPQCRTLLGRWLKTAKDDARRVLRTIEDARDNQVADPVPWIEAALKGKGRGPAADSYEFIFGRH